MNKASVNNFLRTVILIAILIFSKDCRSQTYEELQDIFYYTSKKLDAARDSLTAYKNLDSVVSIQKKQLLKDSLILKNDSILRTNFEKKISILTEKLSKKEEIPFFEFRGFYTGLSGAYTLDSTLISNTVWNNIKYDLTGVLKFTFLDRLDLTCGIGIPIRKENIFLKTNIEWRIFK